MPTLDQVKQAFDSVAKDFCKAAVKVASKVKDLVGVSNAVNHAKTPGQVYSQEQTQDNQGPSQGK